MENNNFDEMNVTTTAAATTTTNSIQMMTTTLPLFHLQSLSSILPPTPILQFETESNNRLNTNTTFLNIDVSAADSAGFRSDGGGGGGCGSCTSNSINNNNNNNNISSNSNNNNNINRNTHNIDWSNSLFKPASRFSISNRRECKVWCNFYYNLNKLSILF